VPARLIVLFDVYLLLRLQIFSSPFLPGGKLSSLIPSRRYRRASRMARSIRGGISSSREGTGETSNNLGLLCLRANTLQRLSASVIAYLAWPGSIWNSQLALGRCLDANLQLLIGFHVSPHDSDSNHPSAESREKEFIAAWLPPLVIILKSISALVLASPPPPRDNKYFRSEDLLFYSSGRETICAATTNEMQCLLFAVVGSLIVRCHGMLHVGRQMKWLSARSEREAEWQRDFLRARSLLLRHNRSGGNISRFCWALRTWEGKRRVDN
jgi:hypothetical protein